MRYTLFNHILILCIVTTVLAGCNTLRGIGHDMQSFGSGMAETASVSREQINAMEDQVLGEDEPPQPQPYADPHHTVDNTVDSSIQYHDLPAEDAGDAYSPSASVSFHSNPATHR